jgi:AcrR family transcriptional regulator
MAEARTYHHGNLRSELLDQAERMVATTGAEKLSLRELARLAGVSSTAPRAHFASKDDLLDALAQRGFDRLHTELSSARVSGTDFGSEVHAVATAYVRFATTNTALLELMFSIARQQPAAFVGISESRAYSVFYEMLARGQQDGHIVAGTPDEVGLPFFAAIHGIAVLLAAGAVPAGDQESIASRTIEVALRGIRRVESTGT